MSLTTISEAFDGMPVEVVVFGSQRYLSAPQIGRALGFGDPVRAMSKLFSRNQREFEGDMTMLIELPGAGGKQLTRIYNARGAALIAMKAQTPKGEAFRRWVLDVLEGKADLDTAPVASAEGIPAGVLHTLREMFLQRKGNTQLVRYRQMGLGTAEIARLLEVKPRSINPRLRVAEYLGLVETPADLGRLQQLPSFQKMMEGKQRWREAYNARKAAAALPAPTGEASHADA